MFLTPLLLLVTGAICDAPFAAITAALQRNNLESARKLIAAVPAGCSQTSSYFSLEGVLDELSGNQTEAENAFRTAIRLDRSSPRPLEQLATALLKNGKPQAAIAPLTEAAKLDPNNPAINKYLIAAYSESGDWNHAAPLFSGMHMRAALEHEPLLVLWWTQALLHTGQASRLETELPAATSTTPAPVLFNIGTTLGENGLYRPAVDYLGQISDRDADEAARFDLGLAYSHLRDFDSARKAYFAAIDRHPDYVESYLHIGLDYAATGQGRRAVPWFHRAHEIAPQRPDISYALSEELIQLGYFDSAREFLSKLPGSESAAAAKGDLDLAQGKLDEAASSYHRALAADSHYGPALVGLARIAAIQNRETEAVNTLNAVLSAAPQDPAANAELGLIESKQRNWSAARTHLTKAWDVDQSRANVACALAAAERNTGDGPAALHLLQSLPDPMRDTLAVHLELAQIYQSSGQREQAQAEREKVVALETRFHQGLRFDQPRSYVF